MGDWMGWSRSLGGGSRAGRTVELRRDSKEHLGWLWRSRSTVSRRLFLLAPRTFEFALVSLLHQTLMSTNSVTEGTILLVTITVSPELVSSFLDHLLPVVIAEPECYHFRVALNPT